MAKKKKQDNPGGLQAPKPKLSEAEQKEVDKAKVKEKKLKDKEEKKKEGSKRWNPFRALRETFSELKKVRWPGFGTAVAKTGVVLGVVAIAGVIIFGIDRGLYALYELLVGSL